MSSTSACSEDQAARCPVPARTVCHITTVHPPFDTRIFQKECRSLVQAGYDVHLVACHPRDETVAGVAIHALPPPPCRLARMAWWPWLACRRVLALRPRPWLCHLHDPELLVLAPLLRARGLRVVYDVHENVPADLLYKPYLGPVARRLASWGYRLVEGLLIGGVATVHVLDEIARNYRPPKVVVRNLPRLDAAAAPPAPADRPAGRARLVYCGIIAADRGAVTMIEAAELLRRRGVDCELLLIGNILDQRLRRTMTDTIARAGLADRVRLTGPLPYAQAMAEVAASDIGLCLMEPSPNNETSLPNKIFEYMWMGVPVVMSNFPNWRPYAEDTGAGLQVDPTSPARVADAVQWLLDRPDRRRQMGESGRRAVESHWCWRNEEAKLLAFYRQLAESGGAAT